MNYKTKHKQNSIFPVNYPKNNPLTTTMHEASNHPSKSSTFKLNFPKMKMAERAQLKQVIAISAQFIARYSSLGGLIFLTVIKRAIKILITMLTPIFIIFNKSMNLVVSKFNEITEDFFRFMDYFFLMDEEILIPISVAAENNEIRKVIRKGFECPHFMRNRFAAFRFNMNWKHENVINNGHNDDINKSSISNLSKKHASYSGSAKPTKWTTKLPDLTVVSVKNMKMFILESNRITLKLPLKTIERRLTRLKSLFKFPFYKRVLIFMDSLTMREYAQTKFAHDE